MPRIVLPGTGERHVPVHLWGRTTPAGALEQLRRVASQPYVVEHVAAMPDLHVAHGIAVGTVFATDETLVPAALGGDLGCGMSAVRFDYPAAGLSPVELGRLLGTLSRLIPVGDAIHRGKGVPVPDEVLASPLSTGALEHARERLSRKHLGTLGGGNHFIELDRDGGGDLWLLVHSGSRGLGAVIATHHLRAAEAEGFGEIPGLRLQSEAGQACLSDIEWALRFARANRDLLLDRATALVAELTGQTPDSASRLDLHHNFVQHEEHFGKRLLVHRKGAIRASDGERALIPGSMATASYIVQGKGERLSFGSASHGAGRVMTRREARERIRPDRFIHSMRRVVFDPHKRTTLVEEAPAAYRDIAEVLEDESDLVQPLIRLEPIAVLKG
jgi:tRNA-splicing ligase RtcB (3'-phosphate/5'-hydroxy nucleic acid ligase)